MSNSRARTSAYEIARWAYFLGTVVAAGFALLQLYSPGPAHPLLSDLVTEVKSWTPTALPLAAAAALLGKYVSEWVGPPWVWRAIHAVLDYVQRDAFSAQAPVPVHEHRVTLFRHADWSFLLRSPIQCIQLCCAHRRWPLAGWLRIEERSGHTTQRSNTVFLAPDDAASATGIAGLAWSCRGGIAKSDLPKLHSGSSDEEVKRYADETKDSPESVRERLRNGKPCARAYMGVPVEAGRGNVWGVVVLDSTDPKGVKLAKDDPVIRFMVEAIGLLVARK